MIDQKSGNIINIASVVGQRGLYHSYDLALPYCCSKGGVIQLTKALAAEVASRLAEDVNARSRLSTSARILVDGQGSARVAAVIAGMARHGVHAR